MREFTYPDVMRFTPLAREIAAEVAIPGSKSITNRVLLIAALAEGRSVLHGILKYADDTWRMIDCLGELGVKIDRTAEPLVIDGKAGRFDTPASRLFVGNSGTTIRFLSATSPLVPLGSVVELGGIERMHQRPIRDLVDAMTQLGSQIEYLNVDGCPPVRISGGGLRGGTCVVRGSISSQYLSALLMAAPLASRDTEIVVEGDLASKPYVDMTETVMRAFGAQIERTSYQRFVIPGNQGYRACEFNIEPDASNATYFFAAAALTGGKITVSGLGTQSMQGDAGFVQVLEAMGCTVQQADHRTRVCGPAGGKLRAIDWNFAAIPDTAQTAAALALFADGPSRLTGLATLRVKETDRIAALATEMRKLGALVEAGADYLTIVPPHAPSDASIDTYDDHRMAMSFSVASLRIPALRINDPGCVAKTFPNFWELWDEIFATVRA